MLHHRTHHAPKPGPVRLGWAALTLLVLPAPLPSAAPLEHTVERRPVLMGTTARIVATGPTREQALATTAAIERILRLAEDELSTWRAGTELDRFNRAPVGRRIELPAELDAELSRALDYAAATGGAFDPAIGALTRAWDLRGHGRIPRHGELEDARRRSGYHLLTRDDGVWRRHRDVVVDEGGFGKGAALDRVAGRLSRAPGQRVLVDLGGQLLLADPGADPEPWPIAVADPDDRSRPVLRLSLSRGSVATSANSERSVGPADAAVGHLLDPRTGRPAADFGSVTVWAPSALAADCLATGLFVAGPDAALDYANRHPGVEVVVVERRGHGLSARASAGLRGRLEALSDRISFRPTAPHPAGAGKATGEIASTVPRRLVGLSSGRHR